MATETIIGNYRIGERIGRGGMGVVYRGRHLKLPREVAVKSIAATSHRDLRSLRDRFEREAYVQSQLDHPGIVKIYDYIVAEQTYYIVMELIEGRSLAQMLEREVCPLPAGRALDLFEQMLDAIAYAQGVVYRDQDGSPHKGLVHRDLKPANILITPDDRVKITDFGIVKLVGSEKTNTGGNYGSPEYVSPEQAEGTAVDPRSDIYSLGIILYEMLTGRPPFHDHGGELSQVAVAHAHIHRQPQPPSEVNPQVTPELEAIILRALEKRPGDRFPSADEFLRAIRRARGRETGGGVKARKSRRSMKGRRKIGTQEIVAPTMPGDARESVETQPVRVSACPACGTIAGAGELRCRRCGSELNASSPATAKLTRLEADERRRARSFGVWLGAGAAVIALAAIIIFLVNRNGARVREEPAQAPFAPQTPAPKTPGRAGPLAEVKAASVAVDSSYDGYTTAPLTDGETDVRRIAAMRYNVGNWASAETHAPHWIEFSFNRPALLASVYVYWGFDRGRFMPSRRVELQVPDGESGWRTISRMEPGKDFDHAAFEFSPVETARARIFQPPQAGPTNRPFIMWVREVKVFAAGEQKP